ncbi:hypothetical protein FACS189472_03750 [Alphaproteobacteria bacterium]|nr:hypothetical protein FACS189472_03750 [Alphaproteobacteria bacterium]
MKKSVLLLSAIVSFAGCMADYDALVTRATAGDLNLSKRALNRIENPTGWLLKAKSSDETITYEKAEKSLVTYLGNRLSEKAKGALATALVGAAGKDGSAVKDKDADKPKVDFSANEKPKETEKVVGNTGEALVGAAKSAAEKELAAAREQFDAAMKTGDYKAVSAASKRMSAISEKLSGVVDLSGTEDVKPDTEKALDSALEELEIAKKSKDWKKFRFAERKVSSALEALEGGAGFSSLPDIESELKKAQEEHDAADKRLKELNKQYDDVFAALLKRTTNMSEAEIAKAVKSRTQTSSNTSPPPQVSPLVAAARAKLGLPPRRKF